MLSLWRSLAAPSRIISVVATRYQGSQVLNSKVRSLLVSRGLHCEVSSISYQSNVGFVSLKACSQFVAGTRPEAPVADIQSIRQAMDASRTTDQLQAVSSVQTIRGHSNTPSPEKLHRILANRHPFGFQVVQQHLHVMVSKLLLDCMFRYRRITGQFPESETEIGVRRGLNSRTALIDGV